MAVGGMGMKARTMLLFAAAALALAGCNEPAQDNSAANAAANAAAAPAKKRPTYCFFKDAETKGWAASRDAKGNLVVKGQAYRSDSRYKAEFVEQEVSAAGAALWVAVVQNTTGYGAPENWWEVTATIPDSSAVESVTVMCGKKTLAQLTVAKKG